GPRSYRDDRWFRGDDRREMVNCRENLRRPCKINSRNSPERDDRKSPEARGPMKIEVHAPPASLKIHGKRARPRLYARPPDHYSREIQQQEQYSPHTIDLPAPRTEPQGFMQPDDRRDPGFFLRESPQNLSRRRIGRNCHLCKGSSALKDSDKGMIFFRRR